MISFEAYCELGSFHLEPGQRVHDAVVYTGLDPVNLELGHELFGSIDHVPAAARRVSVQVKGRDVGGTRRAAVQACRLAQAADLTNVDFDEPVYVLFQGPKLRHARIAKRFALAHLRRLGAHIENESSDGFTLVRHDGRRVIFECIAAARGGDTGRGVTVLFALLDEASFFYDENHETNGTACFSAIVPRLLPQGQIVICSSPWIESGILFDQFQKNFGHPVTALASHCPTLLMRSDPDVRANVASEYARDSINAANEFGAQFRGIGAANLLDPAAVDRCEDPALRLRSRPDRHAKLPARTIAIDLGFRNDASAAVVLHELEGVLVVAETLELTPQPGAPLKPSDVYSAFLGLTIGHVCPILNADHWYFESAAEFFGLHGVQLCTLPAGASGKLRQYEALKSAIYEGRLKMPPNQRLANQLKAIQIRPTSGGGFSITSPRTRGQHGDLASALAGATFALEQMRVQPGRRRDAPFNLPRW